MSTTCAFMSSRPSSNTANSPQGPAPTINTSVLIASPIVISFRYYLPAAGTRGSGFSSQHRRWRKAINVGPRPLQPLAGVRQVSCKNRPIRRMIVNAPARAPSEPLLDNYPFRLTDNVRFADLDPNGHVNNAVYATYFETGRVTLVKDKSRGLVPDGASWMMVRLDIHFRAELRWPGTIELGTGVAKLGRTSTTYEQVV